LPISISIISTICIVSSRGSISIFSRIRSTISNKQIICSICILFSISYISYWLIIYFRNIICCCNKFTISIISSSYFVTSIIITKIIFFKFVCITSKTLLIIVFYSLCYIITIWIIKNFKRIILVNFYIFSIFNNQSVFK
jgi:hypothetical protein